MADDKPALIVQMNADLSKFEGAMKQAGDIADKAVSGIESRFSSAFGGSFFGNLFANFASKGLESAVKLVSDLVDRFIDLEKVSRLVGASMNDLFGIQTAAAKFNVPIDEATASIKGLAVLLDQLQRGDKNSLSALFDANPQALKGINQDALSLQQTFEIVANLVQNARTEIQKIDLAKAAGQAESMVPFLQRGGQAFTELSAAAAKTAPDLQKLVDSAKQFDEAWRTAVTNIKAYLSENILGFFKQDLVDIVALLGVAQKFLGLFKNGPLDSQAAAAAAEFEVLKNAINGLGAARQKLDATAGGPTSSPAGTGQTGTSTRDTASPLSNVPRKDTGAAETRDSFDRTEEQITRHTASVNADTIAVSQNSAVQAQLRAEFQLLNAIRKDDGEVTQAQIDVYTRLRATMEAHQALEASGIQLTTAHKNAFIAASEGAALAQAGYNKAADGVAKLNSASSQLGSALSTAFADAIVEGKNLNDVFTSLLKTLEKAAINSIFSSIFNQQAGGGLSPFASLFKGVIPGFASGTSFAPGGAAWVGEHGPELVNLPRGSQVIPSAIATRGGSGGVVVNLVEDSSRAGQTQKQDNSAGGFDLTVFVDSITAKNAANPGSATSQVLDNRRRVASR